MNVPSKQDLKDKIEILRAHILQRDEEIVYLNRFIDDLKAELLEERSRQPDAA